MLVAIEGSHEPRRLNRRFRRALRLVSQAPRAEPLACNPCPIKTRLPYCDFSIEARETAKLAPRSTGSVSFPKVPKCYMLRNSVASALLSLLPAAGALLLKSLIANSEQPRAPMPRKWWAIFRPLPSHVRQYEIQWSSGRISSWLRRGLQPPSQDLFSSECRST
jgi:hypothetical protein